MKFVPSGTLSERLRERFDGRIAQRYSIKQVLQSFVKFLY